VRSAEREADVRNMIERAGLTPGDNPTFAVADLTSDAGWPEATDGSAFVLHVASPYPADEPADEDAVIMPARDGTLRVVRAARDAGVKRAVLTSSFVAIGCGHRNIEREFTEDDWTDLDGEGI
jgi:dihydroflavonol-4-reductase